MDKLYIKPDHSFNSYKYHWILKSFACNGRLYVEINICKPISNNIKHTFNVKGNISKLIEYLIKFIDKEEDFINQLRLAEKFDMNLFS